MTVPNSIGWVATAVFSISYFCRQATTLRRVQAAAALLWVVYGFLMGAAPVVVANVIVAAVALYSSLRGRPNVVQNEAGVSGDTEL